MQPKKIIFFILLCVAHTPTIFSQDNLKVSGKVVDSNNAAVAGAAVILSRKGVRFEREIVTDASGEFAFTDLAKGNYQISATNKNFSSVIEDVELDADSQISLTLQPAQLAAEVSIISNSLAGTPESLSEIPGSIERISPQVLENSRVFNFGEALRKVTGVIVREEEGFGLRPNIGIRGTNPTRSTKILLLEDGLPLSYAPYGDNASYYHPPVERYESIEVLKGAGQIAYGPVTVAGVVNYITPNPPEEQRFTVKAEGGNRSFFNGGITYGNTFGKLGALLNYNRKQGDGSRENTNSKLNDFSSKFLYAPNERNAFTAKFSFYDEDSNVTYSGLTEAEYLANPRGNIFRNDFFYGERYGFSVNHSALFTPNVVLSTTFYSNYFSRDWWRQSSNSGQRPNRLSVDPDCRSLADLNTTCGNEGRLRDYITTGFEPRLTANFNFSDNFRSELQTGVRVHWEKQERDQLNGDLPTSRSGAFAERNLRKNLAYSGFVQNRFIFGNFAVTPGVRVERIEYQRQNLLTAGSLGKTTLTEFVPGLGITYNAFGNTTIFAGVHRGFAPPRAEDIISNTGGVIELDAERSWNYEVGVRTRPFRGFGFDATFFRNDYENQIVPASLAGGVGSVFTNGGETLQQGFELLGQFDSGTWLNSKHNFYLRTAVTLLPIAEFRGRRFSSVTATALVTGNRLPYAPKQNFTTSLGYSHPIGIDAFIENVYIGRQFSDDLNTVNPIANGQRGAIQAQTYWNATANYKVERLNTTFFVTAKNIFDRTFIIDRSRGILPSIPRLVQAGVKVNF